MFPPKVSKILGHTKTSRVCKKAEKTEDKIIQSTGLKFISGYLVCGASLTFDEREIL